MRKSEQKKKEFTKDYLFYIIMGVLFVFVIVLAIISLFHLKEGSAPPLETIMEIVRQPSVADQFYPGNPKNLKMIVDSFLSNAEDKKLGDVKALIVPHAGYVYSGQVAANGFKQLDSKKDKIKKVFIIGSSHARTAWYTGVEVTNYTQYLTPLGKVKVSQISTELAAKTHFSYNPPAEDSHIIEVELPFLQRILGDDFEVIPLTVGGVDEGIINDVAKDISNYLDDSSIVVVSSDLSHYHPYDDAVKLDTACINQIEAQSFSGTIGCEACGRDPILILLRIAEMRGWKAKIIDYKNSGDTSGDKSSVVGYSAIVFYATEEQSETEVVNKAEQDFLLKLARATVESYVNDSKIPSADNLELTQIMKESRGCFVTLNENGALRGCIGDIIPERPLYDCIIGNAVNAAVNDPRFPPVSIDELSSLDIEISVLTLPYELDYSSPDDLLSKLRPNIDSVVLRSGFRSSTFLPQVWEMFDSKENFLVALCRKQGSPDDCWKNAKVLVYQAQVFHEQK